MEPSTTTIITWVAGSLVVGLVGYLFRRLDKMETRHEELENDYREHLATLPQNYVAKDDYREDVRDIKSTLNELRNYFMGQRL